jgi:hypothetical protein
MGLIEILKKGPGAVLTIFDHIELLIVLCLGTALFGFAFWELTRRIMQSGSKFYLTLFIIFLVISATSIVRDITHWKLGNTSKLFLALWGVCVLIAGWLWVS